MITNDCCSDLTKEVDNTKKYPFELLEDNPQCECNCNCGNENLGDDTANTKDVDFDISIDGKTVKVLDGSKNIVQIAKKAGISIPAPCFHDRKRNGSCDVCCHGCVVEINDEQRCACGTRPKENMNIIVKREDLIKLRKKRLLEYKNKTRKM